MPHATTEGPPIPYSSRPNTTMLYSLMSLPSLKEFMVHRLVDEATHISTMEIALRDYARHRNKMEEVCAGASESTITFMADKLFWRSHWPEEEYPRENCLLDSHDKEVIYRAFANVRVRAREQEIFREQQYRYREFYAQEAQAWSKSVGDKLARMAQKEKQTEDHEAKDDEGKLGLQALAQLEI
ncbi:19d3d2fa-833b-4d2d-a6a6-40df4bb60727 [Sclerotinia trifoliorum]|uniref:19d3d2fa-833b-4d2d-a6a6-40df4bb60727 n=1 Tax=Sclerotinia trifoliorum TaxID=28548 RepID=A0A8H2VLS4_9HELO|nr:19d3d2fa-833b-4d2d-a6a6-40df4bb60727 [Sclerotinia trifoliorum]